MSNSEPKMSATLVMRCNFFINKFEKSVAVFYTATHKKISKYYLAGETCFVPLAVQLSGTLELAGDILI